jgi:hypothetical protein
MFEKLIGRPVPSFFVTDNAVNPVVRVHGGVMLRAQGKDVSMPAKFSLGHVVVTTNARDSLHPEDVPGALARHAAGDWGEVCEADRRQNEISLAEGLRLFSVYFDRNHTKFWIITEADRSATTILLPDDY